jgi:hypothetical protein
MGETRKALLGPKQRHAHRRDQRTQLNRRDAQGANLPHTLNKTNAATSQCLCCQRDGLCSTQEKQTAQNKKRSRFCGDLPGLCCQRDGLCSPATSHDFFSNLSCSPSSFLTFTNVFSTFLLFFHLCVLLLRHCLRPCPSSSPSCTTRFQRNLHDSTKKDL